MNLQVNKERDIPLLKRKRVTLFYSSQDKKTPARAAVLKEVAKKIGATEDRVAIHHIYTRFGSSDSKIIAHVYKDKKTMEKYEQKRLLEKQAAKPKEETQSSEAASAKAEPSEPAEEAKPEAAEEKPQEGAEESAKEEASAEETPTEEKPAEESKPEENQEKPPVEDKKESE